ncbi:MAG TPA: ComF family protein [Longilinea sp.]|nr:ComF family protein [Longilinea sp.]
MTLANLQRPFAFSLYKGLWKVVDWVFPPYCAACGKFGERLCSHCAQLIQPLEEPLCIKCGQPVTTGQVCYACKANPPEFISVKAYAPYTGVLREAVHALKYKGDLGLAEVLAGYLVQLYHSNPWQVDVVIPVPVSTQRKRERGYNQAQLLAQPFTWQIGLPLAVKSLEKVKETQTQVHLAARQRIENVTGAFRSRFSMQGKTILLIDDVITTTATMRACAHALREAGAARVFGLALARAIHGLSPTSGGIQSAESI